MQTHICTSTLMRCDRENDLRKAYTNTYVANDGIQRQRAFRTTLLPAHKFEHRALPMRNEELPRERAREAQKKRAISKTKICKRIKNARHIRPTAVFLSWPSIAGDRCQLFSRASYSRRHSSQLLFRFFSRQQRKIREKIKKNKEPKLTVSDQN